LFPSRPVAHQLLPSPRQSDGLCEAVVFRALWLALTFAFLLFPLLRCVRLVCLNPMTHCVSQVVLSQQLGTRLFPHRIEQIQLQLRVCSVCGLQLARFLRNCSNLFRSQVSQVCWRVQLQPRIVRRRGAFRLSDVWVATFSTLQSAFLFLPTPGGFGVSWCEGSAHGSSSR